MSKQIPLTRGLFALVDDEDFEWLNLDKWQAAPNGGRTYAKRRGHRRKGETENTILMHRAILRPPLELDVDHINGDGLDNRRENLRPVTTSQNLANRKRFKNNTSGYKGVMRRKNGKWAMIFKCEFNTVEEAARAYDVVARMFFGENAKTSFDD